jgi:hypothetical protein
MAHVKDDGEFDAPLDKLWRFLQDQTEGVHNHSMIRGMRPIEQKGNSNTVEMEFVNPDGKTTRKETWRMTFNPPHGFEMESLSGASKGTKYAHKYTSRGNKTRVDVEGEFHFQGMDDTQTREMALGFLNAVFEEDRVNLGRYK